jgi:hypothetical protein
MSNEFQHKSVGSQMTQTEYEHTDGSGHIFDSQAAGDILFASSTTVLSRLGIGTAGKVLAVNSGASAPEYVAALTGVTSVLNTALVIGRDADNDIDFGTDNTILFRADGADQIKLTNGALLPVTDDDIDLGSSSLQFKDGFFDGTLEADAITVGGTAVLTGGAQTAITSILNTSLVVGRDADNDIDFGTDNNIIFRAGAQDQVKLIDGALAPVTDNDVDLGTSSLEFKDAYFDGTVNTDALAMATNTSGNLLIGNGTSFASTAVTDLSEISSIDDSDVFIAIDADGGGLKKVLRSQVVSGLATSSGIASVANDSSPELGGDLDVLTNSIVTGASNRNIALTPHGTGVVRIDGTNGVDIESGAISIKNGGAESYVRFYCESSNAHYTQLQAAPHASYSGNVTVVLPASADTLVGKATTDTLTNKTLTSPKINEDVALTSTATELNLLDGVSGLVQADFTKLAAVDSTATELNIVDGNTTVGTTAVADGDGIVTNDGGTMRQTTVQTFATYFGSEITSMSNLTSVGTLTTLTVDNVITNGTTIGHTDDTDLMTLADGVLTVTGNLDVSGSVETPTIDFTDGDNAITIADGGTTTFPQIATFSAGIDNALDQHFDSTPSDETVSGVTATFTAGEDLVRGECVYLKASDTKMHKAVAAAGSVTPPCIALAAADISANATGKFLLQGFITDNGSFPTYTVGDEVYTPEAETSSQNVPEATAPDSDGDLVQVLGIATGANTLYFNPSLDVIEHA